MEKEPIEPTEELSQKDINRKTFISFLVFGVANILAWGFGWNWLRNQPKVNDLPKPLRTVLGANSRVNKFFFSHKHLAKEYPVEMAVKKVNTTGDAGLAKEVDINTWRLAIHRHPRESTPSLQLNINDIKALPKRDIVFDFKCIEGWSQVSHWSGVSFADFMLHYNLGTRSGKAPDPEHPEDLYNYAGLRTPDGKYYVGIDMKSVMHPQTLLCYENNNRPLAIENGYPLRLIIPVKYGIKNLKCIGSITFTDTRPADYWHEQGYDYDAAL